jgi:hypothetical protein
LLLSAALVLGMAGLAGVPCQPALAETRDTARALTLLNTGQKAIDQLYVSPSDAELWGDDQLAGAKLVPGGMLQLRVPQSAGCLIDIQVIYADAGHEERHGVDLCRTGRVSFDGSTVTKAPAPAGPPHHVAVTDQADLPIAQVFISDPGADDWGEDRLTDGPIAVGGTADIAYRGACRADLRVVFDNRAAEERRDVALCDAPVLVHPGWTTQTAGETASGHPPAAAPAEPGRRPLVRPIDEGETVIEMLDVTNRSRRPVIALSLIPADAQSGGAADSLLGGDVLAPGAHTVVAFSRDGKCRFTAVVRHGGAVSERRIAGLDLCRSHAITVPPLAASPP